MLKETAKGSEPLDFLQRQRKPGCLSVPAVRALLELQEQNRAMLGTLSTARSIRVLRAFRLN